MLLVNIFEIDYYRAQLKRVFSIDILYLLYRFVDEIYTTTRSFLFHFFLHSTLLHLLLRLAQEQQHHIDDEDDCKDTDHTLSHKA